MKVFCVMKRSEDPLGEDSLISIHATQASAATAIHEERSYQTANEFYIQAETVLGQPDEMAAIVQEWNKNNDKNT